MPRTSPCRCCRSGRHREVFFHCSAGGTEHSMSPLCHPAACSSFTRKLSRVRCCCRGGGGEKQSKTKQTTARWVFFLFCTPSPFSVIPAGMRLRIPLCVLLLALPLIVCSDCVFPTLRIMVRDHPWLRAGSLSPPARRASAGKAASRELCWSAVGAA